MKRRIAAIALAVLLLSMSFVRPIVASPTVEEVTDIPHLPEEIANIICDCHAAFSFEDVERYTVLVLDTSAPLTWRWGDGSYTAGSPINYTRDAARVFIEQVGDASNIAIISYDGFARVHYGNRQVTTGITRNLFSINQDHLLTSLDSLSVPTGDYDNTIGNISSALILASELLATTPENAILNVVLFTSGVALPYMLNDDSWVNYTYEGRYGYEDSGTWHFADAPHIRLYQTSNYVLDTATQVLHEQGFNVYTIGLFQEYEHITSGHSMYRPVGLLRRLTADIASSSANHISVGDVGDLAFAFGNVAEHIRQAGGRFFFTSPLYEDGQLVLRDFPANFYWNQYFFSQPTQDYNPSLAAMSMAFAMSAFPAEGSGNHRNAHNLLSQIGFTCIKANYYFANAASHQNSIGAVAAHRDIVIGENIYTLIAFATRGAFYNEEWVSNARIGERGYHAGFHDAADLAYDFLSNYMYTHSCGFRDNVMIWITGFGRGAGVANILAGRLARQSGTADIFLSPNNIYAYTFATPSVVPTEQLTEHNFTNIHNIIHPSDFFSHLPMSGWGFERYGATRVLPNVADIYMINFLQELGTPRALDSITLDYMHILDTFIPVDINMGSFPNRLVTDAFSYIHSDFNTQSPPQFLANISRALSVGFDNRVMYAGNIEAFMGRVLYHVAGHGPEHGYWMDAFDIFLSQVASPTLLDNAHHTFFDARLPARDTPYRIRNIAIDSMIQAGLEINMQDAAALYEIINALFTTGEARGLMSMLAFVTNINVLGSAHYPEFYFAWLMSLDSNYGGEYSSLPCQLNSADESDYLVRVASNNKLGGSAIGGGFYLEGATTRVVAIPYDGSFFSGWYENNRHVSSDYDFWFRVDRDVELTARFVDSGYFDFTAIYLSVTSGLVFIGLILLLRKGRQYPDHLL
ncbi:MAG: hypothetical protein FWC73_07465 [Defluviitaleaceae bacterium]|nr:hypothetical protein [Defluviitaleaceae bacterium]